MLAGVAAFMLIAAAFAHRLPILHGLPGIGAPRLHATFQIDGRGEDLTFRVPEGEDEERSVLLQVGVRNSDRLNVTDATVNLLMTEGIRRWKADHSGRPDGNGRGHVPEPL